MGLPFVIEIHLKLKEGRDICGLKWSIHPILANNGNIIPFFILGMESSMMNVGLTATLFSDFSTLLCQFVYYIFLVDEKYHCLLHKKKKKAVLLSSHSHRIHTLCLIFISPKHLDSFVIIVCQNVWWENGKSIEDH